MNPQKIGGLVIILLGVPFGLFAADRILLSFYVSLGLWLIIFAKEHVNDERVQQLKMKALFTAMGAFFGALLVDHMHYLDFLAAHSKSDSPGLSSPELLAVVLLIALGLFHYWRWQDGREGGDQEPKTVNH